jgi:nitronate monooxygenase
MIPDPDIHDRGSEVFRVAEMRNNVSCLDPPDTEGQEDEIRERTDADARSSVSHHPGSLRAFSSPDEFQEDIRRAKAATEKPFAVNFTVLKDGPADTAYHEDYLTIALDEGVGTIFTSAYDGSILGRRAKKAGRNWIHKCATLEHAVSTAKKGVDAIVIVGIEGAGMKNPNQCSTLVNMTVARRLIDVPLIAAGGIGDAHGFLAALSMGASGIYMGTAFMATREFQIPQGLKDGIVDQEILDAEYRNKVLRGERGNHPSLASGVVDSIPTVKEFIDSLVTGAEEIVSEFKQWGMID